MKPKPFLCLVLALYLGLPGCSTGTGPRDESRTPAPITDGLQMSLSIPQPVHEGDPEFQVTLRNVGEADVCLNLGYMLANGQVMIPDKIGLNLTDNGGKLKELRFVDRNHAGISGRVDDYVVPLRAGSTYTVALRFDQFVSPVTGESELKLKPGHHELSVWFQGGGATALNSDTGGVKLMNFWKGKLQSNMVTMAE